MNGITLFENKKAKTVTMEIDGYIGFDFWKTWDNPEAKQNTKERVKQELKDIASIKAEKIIVNINSYGGDINHGISIHDLLAENKATVETRVTGMTASAATVVGQSASPGQRKMSDNALYLIHKASTGVWGNANEVESILDDLKKIDSRIVRLYSKRSGKAESEIMDLMEEGNHQGKWLSAEEALEHGLIDEIFEPTQAAASFINHITPELLHKNSLPPVPENYKKTQLIKDVDNFTEQKSNNISNDSIEMSNNKEFEEMGKTEIAEMNKLFGPEKTMEYIEKDISIEDAKTEFIEMMKTEMKELSETNNSHVEEIIGLKSEIEAKNAEITDLKEGVDPLPGGSSTEAIDNEIEEGGEKLPVETFEDKVKAFEAEGMNISDATVKASREFPELHDEYKASLIPEKE
jgi:ATP-dependent Clp endopeptidase proteolytic subunit ClpP